METTYRETTRGRVIAAYATLRDQEAARSNRRASLVSVTVTSQWCAQEAADQAARTPWEASWSPTWLRTIMKVCSMLLAGCGR